MDANTWSALLKAARAAQANAYAPYSRFRVGAAALADDGRVFAGANVENASYGVTLCAERAALAAAVASGARRVSALVVAADGAAAPCGACRQFIFELNPAMRVYWSDGAGGWLNKTAAELLPEPFTLGAA